MADRDDRHDADGSTAAGLDPPPSAEELAATEELARALKSAWRPEPIDAREHDELIERVLERTMASRHELKQAAELRRALEDESVPSEEADLARSLKAAWLPRPLGALDHEGVVERVTTSGPRRGVLLRVSFGAGAALALAAAVLFVVGQLSATRAPTASNAESTQRAADLVQSRSTQPLFDKPFERGAASARIDRIALARAGDLRENRFAMWGVR
jgi:hypothetical protein